MSKITGYTNIPRLGLVGEWLLDGSSLDTSGNDNDGVSTNLTWVNASKGYAKENGSFGGTSVIDCGDFTIGDFTTISFWVKTTDTNAHLLEKWTGTLNQREFEILVYNNALAADFSTDGTTVVSPIGSTINDGKWHHVIGWYDGTDFKLYLDNSQDTTNAISGTMYNSTSPLYIGGNDGTGDFTGEMGIIRIYNRALNESERTALYVEGQRKLGPTNLLASPKTALTDGLVGEWPLNGHTDDLSGNGNDGTPTSLTYSPAWAGEIGTFNGTSSDINLPTLPSKTDFTISAWVKFDDLVDYQEIIMEHNETPRNLYEFRSNGNKLQYTLNDGTYNGVDGTITLTAGKWHHCIYQYISSTGTRKGYIDGVLDVEDTNASYSGMYFDGDLCHIGSYENSARFFDGNISLPKIYDKVLSQSEITQLYNEGAKYIEGPKSSLPNLQNGLVLSLDGDGNDQSGNGNTGTLTNVTKIRKGLHTGGDYNGTSSYVDIGDVGLGTGDITLNTWFKIPTNDDLRHALITLHDTNAFSNKIEFYIGNNSENDAVTFQSRDGADGAATGVGTTACKDGTWRMATLTRVGTNIKLYINGNEEVSVIDAENAVNPGAAYDIGAFEVSGTLYNPFNGSIIEPKIWNRALTTLEIQQEYYLNYLN